MTFLSSRGLDHNPFLINVIPTVASRLVVLFLVHLSDTGSTVSMIQRSIAGLKFHFNCNSVPLTPLISSDVTAARIGCSRTCKKSTPRVRLPISGDMVSYIRRRYWGADVDDAMTYLGVVLAFHFMLRASELVLTSTDQHRVMSEDVEYVTNPGPRLLKSWNLKSIPYIKRMVTMVLITIPSSKTDQQGSGRFLCLKRGSTKQTELVEDLVEWGLRSGAKPDEPFLSRYKIDVSGYNRHKKLTYKMLTNCIKSTAEAFGFKREHFAFHSLRIGGATSQMAAGGDRDMMKRVGGWSANANTDVLYSRNTSHDEGTLAVLERDATGEVLTAADVHLLVPRTKQRRSRTG